MHHEQSKILLGQNPILHLTARLTLMLALSDPANFHFLKTAYKMLFILIIEVLAAPQTLCPRRAPHSPYPSSRPAPGLRFLICAIGTLKTRKHHFLRAAVKSEGPTCMWARYGKSIPYHFREN